MALDGPRCGQIRRYRLQVSGSSTSRRGPGGRQNPVHIAPGGSHLLWRHPVLHDRLDEPVDYQPVGADVQLDQREPVNFLDQLVR